MKRSKAVLGKVYPWLIALCIFLVSLELGLYLLVEHGAIPVSFPAYSWKNQAGSRFYVDEPFGAWHKPNTSFIHRMGCFSVEYASNSYGARDKERSKNSQEPKVLMLGDSFVEGIGVDTDKRLSDILERSTGMEHLNFGTAGSGPTQQALLYESLAMDFDHGIVVIGMLPHNDFMDDDIGVGKQLHPGRYRPYYVRNYPDYEIAYSRSRPDPVSVPDSGVWNRIKSFLREYTFTYNSLSYIKRMFRSYETKMVSGKHKDDRKGKIYFGYYNYSKDQLIRARFSIEKIVGLASGSGKNVVLFTIPIYTDFVRYGNDPSSPPLHTDLEMLSKEIGFEYLDLLPFMFEAEADWKKFFNTCDSHWNHVGNRKVAEILLENSLTYHKMATQRNSHPRPSAGVTNGVLSCPVTIVVSRSPLVANP